MAQCYMQGSFSPTAAATVRVTYDPTGAASTSDWPVLAADEWFSLDLLLSEWQAEINGDLGPGKVTITNTSNTSTHTSTIRIGTDGPNFSIAWSHAGDGGDLRDWLGSTGDLTNQPDGTALQTRTRAGYYGEYGAQVARITSLSRPRAMRVNLDGSVQTQHAADILGRSQGSVDVRLLVGAGTNQAGISAFEDFVNELHDEDGGGEPFAIYHDDDVSSEALIVRFADPDLMVWIERLRGSQSNTYWQIAFSCALVQDGET